MRKLATRLRRTLCSHEYELMWKDVTEGTEALRCRRCGQTKRGS
jgi:hypothetical protein